MLATEGNEYREQKYYSYLQIYTDGSVLDTGQTRAGCVIPALKMSESLYLGKDRSIYTEQLTAILMALNKILSQQKTFLNILLCVDSISVLQSLDFNTNKSRGDII